MFRRSSAGATDDTAQAARGVPEGRPPGSTQPGAQVQGALDKEIRAAEAKKGRPTPKRSEAERNRYQSITGGRSGGTRTTSPSRPARPLTAEEKSSAKARDRSDRNRKMAAMKRGEEWALSARDKGAPKRLARDYVDSHRRPSEFYMYALIVILILMVSHVTAISSLVSYLVGVLIVILIIDGFLIRTALRKLVAERLPGESARGLTTYAVMRAMQIRQWRMPAPQVKPGTKI